MLAAVPAGESPAGGDCPVATVVIPGVGKGDQPDGSPGCKGHVQKEHAAKARNHPWACYPVRHKSHKSLEARSPLPPEGVQPRHSMATLDAEVPQLRS